MVEIVCRSPKQLIILECTRYPSIDDWLRQSLRLSELET